MDSAQGALEPALVRIVVVRKALRKTDVDYVFVFSINNSAHFDTLEEERLRFTENFLSRSAHVHIFRHFDRSIDYACDTGGVAGVCACMCTGTLTMRARVGSELELP